MNTVRFIVGAGVSAAWLFGAARTPAVAQAPTATSPAATATAVKLYAPLPAGMTAEKILDRFVQASGGKATLSKVKTTVQRGTINVGAQNIKGKFESYIKLPNKMYSVQELENVGKFETGFDGKTGWGKDPINGVRTLKGQELAQIQRQIKDAKKEDWRAAYKSAEALGVRKVEGKDAYAVRLTPRTSGKPLILYFDPETGLLIRMDMIVEQAQGTFPTESYFSDYRVVSGQKMPFLIRNKVGPSEATTILTEIKINEPIPDSKFARPQ